MHTEWTRLAMEKLMKSFMQERTKRRINNAAAQFHDTQQHMRTGVHVQTVDRGSSIAFLNIHLPFVVAFAITFYIKHSSNRLTRAAGLSRYRHDFHVKGAVVYMCIVCVGTRIAGLPAVADAVSRVRCHLFFNAGDGSKQHPSSYYSHSQIQS